MSSDRRARAGRGAASPVADGRGGRRRRACRRGGTPPAHARRGGGPGAGARAARPRARGRPQARPRVRPRAAVGPARTRQDHAGDDHRQRDVGPAAADQRAGDHPRRRPGRDPLGPQRRRRALRRRDPPDGASRRRDALHGDGGLPGRRRDRQGPGRHGDPAGDPAVHPGRRHHAGRPAAGSAARPLRFHRSARVLRGRRARPDREAVGRAAVGGGDGRRYGGDRLPFARHSADRQPAAAPGP